MSVKLCEDLVSIITTETVKTIPHDLLSFYTNLPGRSPSQHSRKISDIVSSLDSSSAIELMRDVTDMTVFGILYLLDNRFKTSDIQVIFRRGDEICNPSE